MDFSKIVARVAKRLETQNLLERVAMRVAARIVLADHGLSGIQERLIEFARTTRNICNGEIESVLGGFFEFKQKDGKTKKMTFDLTTVFWCDNEENANNVVRSIKELASFFDNQLASPLTANAILRPRLDENVNKWTLKWGCRFQRSQKTQRINTPKDLQQYLSGNIPEFPTQEDDRNVGGQNRNPIVRPPARPRPNVTYDMISNHIEEMQRNSGTKNNRLQTYLADKIAEKCNGSRDETVRINKGIEVLKDFYDKPNARPSWLSKNANFTRPRWLDS